MIGGAEVSSPSGSLTPLMLGPSPHDGETRERTSSTTNQARPGVMQAFAIQRRTSDLPVLGIGPGA